MFIFNHLVLFRTKIVVLFLNAYLAVWGVVPLLVSRARRMFSNKNEKTKYIGKINIR
jgi:hypothetical protein